MKQLIRKINELELENIQKKQEGKADLNTIPLKSFVSVHYKTLNGDTRIFRGIVIAKKNNYAQSTISVSKTDANPSKRLHCQFMYYSDTIKKIEVERLAPKKHRRSKLYYLKSLFGRKLSK